MADCGRALLAHLTVLPLSAICLGKTFEGFDDSESEKDKVFFFAHANRFAVSADCRWGGKQLRRFTRRGVCAVVSFGAALRGCC